MGFVVKTYLLGPVVSVVTETVDLDRDVVQEKSLQCSTHLPGTRRHIHRIKGPLARGQCTHTIYFENIPPSAQSAVKASSESRKSLQRLDIFREGFWSRKECSETQKRINVQSTLLLK